MQSINNNSQPKKSKAKKRVLIGIGITVLLLIIIGAAGNKSNQTSTDNSAADNTPIDAPAPQASTPAPAPKTWQQVFQFSGNSEKRSESFALTGAQARLKYTVTGDQAYVSIYLMKDGTSLDQDGGFPEVTVTQPGSDETQIVKPAGSYYLEVHAANANWTATVEELK